MLSSHHLFSHSTFSVRLAHHSFTLALWGGASKCSPLTSRDQGLLSEPSIQWLKVLWNGNSSCTFNRLRQSAYHHETAPTGIGGSLPSLVSSTRFGTVLGTWGPLGLPGTPGAFDSRNQARAGHCSLVKLLTSLSSLSLVLGPVLLVLARSGRPQNLMDPEHKARRKTTSFS